MTALPQCVVDELKQLHKKNTPELKNSLPWKVLRNQLYQEGTNSFKKCQLQRVEDDSHPLSSLKSNTVLHPLQDPLLSNTTIATTTTTTTKKQLPSLSLLAQWRLEATAEWLEPNNDSVTNYLVELKNELINAWSLNQRVQSLRLAIKSFKVLLDNHHVISNSIFACVTDTLETFSNLVYERIKVKAEETSTVGSLPTNFTSADVSLEAKETCRNWFYKTACIRELVPRILTEIALLKSYRFISNSGQYSEILSRLSSMIRGIGDTNVALFARMYLALSASEYYYHSTSLCDYFYTIKDITLSSESSKALGWFVKASITNTNSKEIKMIFDFIDKHKNLSTSSVIFYALLEHLPVRVLVGAKFVMSRIEKISTNRSRLVRLLGQRMLEEEDMQRPYNLALLNRLWSIVIKENRDDLKTYLECAETYIQVIFKYYSTAEALILLKDIVSRVAVPVAVLSLEENSVLDRIVELFLVHCSSSADTDFFKTSCSEFSQLLLKLRPAVRRIRETLELVVVLKSSITTDNIHTIFSLCKHLHDLTSSTSSKIILCAFIRHINRSLRDDYDPQQMLNLYTDCRAAFTVYEDVYVTLIHSVLTLVMTTSRIDNRDVICACIAYCHITIPSISSTDTQIQLYLLVAQVALVNSALPQAEAALYAFITKFPSLTNNSISIRKMMVMKAIGLLVYFPSSSNNTVVRE